MVFVEVVTVVVVVVMLSVLQLLQHHTYVGPLTLIFSTESGLVFGAFIGSSLKFVQLTPPAPHLTLSLQSIQ